MTERKEYGSAIRSKRLIRSAFLELLRIKSFEKITVTDVVKKAEINRSTFYAHYPDVMGLIEEIQEEIVEYMKKAMREIDFSLFFENPHPVMHDIITLLENNSELYRLLIRSNMASKQLKITQDVLVQEIKQSFMMIKKDMDIQKVDLYIRFFMGGMIEVYGQWLRGDITSSLGEITDHLTEVIICTAPMLEEINNEK